jgi:chromosome partitioning protein
MEGAFATAAPSILVDYFYPRLRQIPPAFDGLAPTAFRPRIANAPSDGGLHPELTMFLSMPRAPFPKTAAAPGFSANTFWWVGPRLLIMPLATLTAGWAGIPEMECMPVINQKGGVGKTATAVNLGAALAQRGRRVLLIDLDPQGHLTTHLGLDDQARGAGTYEVLTKGLPLDSAIHPYSPSISVVPAQIELAAAEVELISAVGREAILRDALAARTWPFDIAMIDCPPSLGILTLNALSAATQVLIPVQPHFLALQGVGKLFETIALVAQRINPDLRVAGMVMCLHEPGTRLSGEVIADLSAFLESARNSPVPWRDAKLMETRIRRNVKLAECPSYGQSIFEYEPRSHGAADYLALADELSAMLATRRPAATEAQTAPGREQASASQPESAGVDSPSNPQQLPRASSGRAHAGAGAATILRAVNASPPAVSVPPVAEVQDLPSAVP